MSANWSATESHAVVVKYELTVAAPCLPHHSEWHWSVWRRPVKSPGDELAYGSATTEEEAKAKAEAWVAEKAKR
jgi:hypothetical protein